MVNMKKQRSCTMTRGRFLRQIGVIVLTLLISIFSGCGMREKMEAQQKAKEKADFIMQNLGLNDVTDQFPEKYFPKQQVKPFLDGLTKNCDFASKRGKYVDFFSMLDKGKNRTAFIYEYILSCDSIRFIYI